MRYLGRQKRVVACFLFSIAALWLGVQDSYAQQLVVKNGQTGEVGWSADINDGEEFSVIYIHSVDRLPVHEFYINKDGQLFLTGIKVIDFGAGLDYTGEGKLRMDGKWTYIDNMHRKIDSLPLRIGSVADHTLIYRDKRIRLQDHFSAFTLVRLELK